MKKAAPPRPIETIAKEMGDAARASRDADAALSTAIREQKKARTALRALKRELNLAAVGRGVRR